MSRTPSSSRNRKRVYIRGFRTYPNAAPATLLESDVCLDGALLQAKNRKTSIRSVFQDCALHGHATTMYTMPSYAKGSGEKWQYLPFGCWHGPLIREHSGVIQQP